MNPAAQQLLAAVILGLLLSLSAGVRMTIPLLVLSFLAFRHLITLPSDLAWMGTEPTLILLGVACIVETAVHFIPAVGTVVKAVATPLAFVAGTLLMAVPLGDRNPLFQWLLAGALGGGVAALTHLGFTGARTITGPANLLSGGTFGIGWNLLELFASVFFIVLGWICVVAGWVFGLVALVALGVMAIITIRKLIRLRTEGRRPLVAR